MSDMGVQPVAEASAGSGLSQMQRVIGVFTAPSKTFEDIKQGNRSWWLPFVITVLSFVIFFGAVTTKVTWSVVYQNEQRNMPEFAKRMQDQAPPESRAAQQKAGPVIQAVQAGLAPIGVLIVDLIAAGVLLATINFVFGGKAKFSSLFAVTLYAGLVRSSSLVLYAFLASLDALSIWCMVVTSIGVATVAGVKRGSGYIAVFGWWFVGLLIGVGLAAAFS
jgi:hypothetical protein